jgi:hypothetical protein
LPLAIIFRAFGAGHIKSDVSGHIKSDVSGHIKSDV